MPRTIESILACHREASARRKAGKPSWDYRVDVASILDQERADTSDEGLAAKAKKIAALLKAKLPARWFDEANSEANQDFIEMVERFASSSVEEFVLDRANGFEPIEVFDGWLEELYDWADNSRVWLR